jgi:hypothetical protein
VRIARRFLPFPQPLGLGAALLEVQLWLLGKLLAVALPGGQLQLLELLLGAVSLTKSNQGLTTAAVRRDAALARQRYANCVAVAVVGLAGLAPVAKRVRGGAEPQDKVRGALGCVWRLTRGVPGVTCVIAPAWFCLVLLLLLLLSTFCRSMLWAAPTMACTLPHPLPHPSSHTQIFRWRRWP